MSNLKLISMRWTTLDLTAFALPGAIRALLVITMTMPCLASCTRAVDEDVDLLEVAKFHDALSRCKDTFKIRYKPPTSLPNNSLAEWLASGLAGPEKIAFQKAGERMREKNGHSYGEQQAAREAGYRELVRQFEIANICGVKSGLADLEMFGDVVFSEAIRRGVSDASFKDERARRQVLTDMSIVSDD